MIDLLIKKAQGLLFLLFILAVLLAGVVAYAAGTGDSAMILYFALGVLAYGCWRIVRALRWLWRKLRPARKHERGTEESVRPAVWLSPRTLRTRRSAITHDSRGMTRSSKRARNANIAGSALYSAEYGSSTRREQADQRPRWARR